jgi:phosphoribulokinase
MHYSFGSLGSNGHGTEFTGYKIEGAKAVFTRASTTMAGDTEATYDREALSNRIQKLEDQGQAVCVGANEREALAKLQELNLA